ncbi:type I glyceraldehyde-3-phosphate dehydrogenase [Arthrobacter sp. MSA 4-2]|uniref:type I glyceraldehyde-3-phosphate dehydrogenase n=1 Tax=Arthrobacter sp. MSA 4-2 TaxID=2794349 RepID=UPI0018E6E570|nr:type I glyceraldehyde-3-phosphate dehydrogenase [Arthrobacter sp. MSA 4-2]MBJ2121490.1 type I glyceraldehyde-3-phosphate dehydrogenase [Arthrobacter sp. MSA 4-2]
MTVRVAINGFGRIGRSFLRAALQQNASFEVVAVNDLADPETLAHLLRYDSVGGKLSEPITHEEGRLLVGGHSIQVFRQKNPVDLPWAALKVDVVIESTGFFTKGSDAARHLAAGAKKVIISAPSTGEDITLLLGVNDDQYEPGKHHIISNASCTTNSVGTIAKVLHEAFGIERALMTTIHAYTADQNLHDGPHKDLRRARAAAINMVPTSTGAARAIGVVMPELNGKIDGYAMRVPVPVGSATDLTATLSREVSEEEINAAFKAAAEGPMKAYLTYTEDPIVSSDIVENPSSSIFDAGLTKAVGNQVKIVAWYDNEWGFSNRLVDLTHLVGSGLMPSAGSRA